MASPHYTSTLTKGLTAAGPKTVCTMNVNKNDLGNSSVDNVHKDRRLWGDIPRIKVEILEEEYTCLTDTGCSVCVMSEAIFQSLRMKDRKMPVLPTNGIVCSGALRKQKQRVKFQVMINLRVGTGSYEVLFLVVPGLNPDLIIGLDLLEAWRALINLETYQLTIKGEQTVETVPFLMEGEGHSPEDAAEPEIASELFFVEKLEILGDECIRKVECLPPPPYESDGQSGELERGLILCADEEYLTPDVTIGEHDPEVILVRHVSARDEIREIFKSKVESIDGSTAEQRDQLYRVLQKHSDVFSERIGLCTEYTHEFQVTNREPYNHKCRNVPTALMEKTDEAISKLIRDGILETSHSSYVNPLCIVQKADKTVRLTIDARTLNQRTVFDHFRNESIQSQINKINGAKYYSILDLSHAFLQVPLKEECRQFTAFLHRGRQYRFTRTPFGLASSGAALMRAIDKVFGDQLRDCAAQYVDDYCIFSNDLDQHIRDLDFVLGKFRESGFTVKADKLQLGRRQVEFLGYIISEEGIRPNPTKIGEILDIPPPKNAKQLRRFFGICQYQSRFLINFSKEVQPLRALLKKDTRWKWTAEMNEAFIRVKNLFAKSVLLQRPDFDVPFTIYTDASQRGVACVLVQEKEPDECRVIATASRALSNPECRMFVTEIEVAAIYFALQKFRDFVFNRQIIIKSDNISLAFLQKCKLTSSRISRYIHEIMTHDIEIQHVKGTENIFADLLSRFPPAIGPNESIDSRENREFVIMRLRLKEQLNLSARLRDLAAIQQSVPEYVDLIGQAPEIGTLGAKESKYGTNAGLLYKKTGRMNVAWKVCIPDKLAEELILAYHEHLGHSGSDRVALAMEQSFYVKRLVNKCRKIIGACLLCLRAKPMNIRYDYEPQCILRDRPNALVCVDIHGKMPRSNFGYQYVFVTYDVFTKFTKIYPLKAMSTRACLDKILNDYLPKYGKMEAILSDNASVFASAVWRETLREHDIKCYHSSYYHPISNMAERSIRNVSIYFRAYCHDRQKSWYQYCPMIEAIINRSPNPTTKVCPEKLMTGKEPESLFVGLPATIPVLKQSELDERKLVFEKLRKRAEKRKERMTRSKKLWEIKIGDKVLAREHHLSSLIKGRSHRLELLYRGPLTVVDKFGETTFELRDDAKGKIIGRYNKVCLKPYRENSSAK